MSNYLFSPVQTESCEEVCRLLTDCFADDPYFVQQYDGADLRRVMSEMFRHSVVLCLESRQVFGWRDTESKKLVAVSLWFDYNKLRRDRPDDFQLVFCWPELTHIRNELEARICETIGEDSEYLYLLSIAVDPAHRRHGLALEMIRRVMVCYCQYNIFSDVSNDRLADALIRRFGFSQTGQRDGCRLLRCLTPMSGRLGRALAGDKIPVIVPEGYNPGILSEIPRTRVCFSNLRAEVDTPYFIQDITAEVAYGELLVMPVTLLYRWQQLINPLLCEEIEVRYGTGDECAVVYVHQPGTPVVFLHYGGQLLKDIECHRKEWGHVVDMYTLIPMAYDDSERLQGGCPESVNVRRMLRAVNFRAKYESGIYVEGKQNHSFASRVSRKFLEMCVLQLYCESELSLDGLRASDREIGEPVVAALTVSYDHLTSCAVLQITLISCGLLLTQHLDSVSRNQISIITPSGKENLYEYVQARYGLHKQGAPKNYINFHDARETIDDGLLASVLYCETYYENEEALGGVIDKNITGQLEHKKGLAQYNYAAAYFYMSSVVHVVGKTPCVRERLIGESVTLFYIEMVLYEEAAIEIMNHNVVHFLTNVSNYRHGALIRRINLLLNKHLMSIAFWNMQMNYPSSTVSLDLIRSAFGIEEKRADVERNKQQLLALSQIRENYLSYMESRIITILGLVLTLLSIVDFVMNTAKPRMLVYPGIAFILIWIYFRNRLFQLRK